MRLVAVGIVAAIVVGGGRAKADFVFGEPVNLGPTVNTSYGEVPDCFSADGLEMYISSGRPRGHGNWDLWVAMRETIDDDWDTPVNLGPIVNSVSNDWTACITLDGLELYFCSDRSGGYGSIDMWVTRRATKNDAWGRPENLGSLVNGPNWDGEPWISPDGLELYFYSRNRAGGHGGIDIWISRRETKNDPWGEPVNIGPVVNSSAHETAPYLSPDGLALFFSGEIIGSFRPGGFGGSDIWMSRRWSISDPWGEPVNLGPIVNNPSHDCLGAISPDGSMLYFCSERPGGFGGQYGDIYQAPIIPILDLNSDGFVDAADMCIIVDDWGTDEPLCDIGPMPWGDGVVDVQDLKVLAEHLFEEIYDPTLVAHWPLDQTEGIMVVESIGGRKGYAIGDPVWQPNGGIVNGAIQLDGIDDYVVITGIVPNPAEAPFSVLAWINGGSTGQVVVSQPENGANWLMTDAEGNLISELRSPGRDGNPILSQTNVNDGNWHRIGLVWDGSNRTLYVDDIAVAQDTQDSLEGSDSGLYIGCGKGMETGTFFSGLIDDLRIYNRVVIP
jgi:hypothetical protein